MDKIAILSDIHGNVTALNRVLTDIRQRGITTIYNLGDFAGKGPRGAEAIDLCRQHNIPTVMGNWDTLLVDPPPQYEDLIWHREQLGSERLEYLAQLPPVINFQLSGKRIRLFHASAQSIWHRVYHFSDKEEHLGMFANTDFTGHEQPEPDVICYGDIHAMYALPTFNPEGRWLLNAGSCGNPLDEATTCYLILKGELGEKSAPFSFELVRLDYDIEAELKIAREMGMPALAEYEIELQTAVYRGSQKK